MNRTDRLYALVEDLRAVAPRVRTARELSQRYEVSSRTIERDISALQQAGVPIYADVGRRGGYALERTMSLPPLNFTPAEAVAIAVALERSQGAPFDRAGRSALGKIMAVMPARNASGARELAARVGVLESADAVRAQEIPAVLAEAIEAGRVLRITYRDKTGENTEREVEPSTFLVGGQGWYLMAWCRLREESRCFRIDRIGEVAIIDAPVSARATSAVSVPDCVVRAVSF
ncbi:helix-turn-helix transcriptional regulator [Nocardia jejuensis]|uniref:helix-turn-helix transcriptional regulator n=1 Tax=Nocardia jejuensis TaxID=328049 RepID=UPI00082B24F5|nr:YafY family protein [Nocardia jejuensis]